MDCTEMTFDSCEDIVVYYVEKFHFKTTFTTVCSCDIFGILTTAQKNMELLIISSVKQWADCSISAWETIVKFSYGIKGFWMNKFAESVTTASEKHSLVI